uniref:Helicase ATP-binding domain-containing protein n=1 Tax=Peronospora matthiolae TaxID=2874970 RepID=A0AAV1V387_9STRA
MRRSTRLEHASSGQAPRMSELIAQHAQLVRQGTDESDDEWRPDGKADTKEEEDGEFSGSASSSEGGMAKRYGRVNKRKILNSDGNDQEKRPTGPRSKMKKMKRVKRPIENSSTAFPSSPRGKAKKSVATAVKRSAAEIKDETKRPGNRMESMNERETVSDPHRRPMKQPKRANVRIKDDRVAQQTTVSHSGLPSNYTLDNFFDEILEWKFFEALRQGAQSSHSSATTTDVSEEGEVGSEAEVEKVPSKFRSYEHYFSVWKPLALEEVQAQTINAVTSVHPSPIPVTVKGFGATFISTSCKIRVDSKKKNASGTRRGPLNDLFINDLVLISPDADYFRTALASSKGGHSERGETNGDAATDTPPLGFLAIVATQKASKEGLTMTILRSGWVALEKEKNIHLFKLNNLITSVREFRALCECSRYGLLPLLLSGKHKQENMQLDSLGLKYVQWLSRTFNDSQREAITAAATSEGFTLIKGPPGTGKTTTLKGLLNSLHLREYNRYYNAVLDVARRPDNQTAKAWARVGNEKPHILVTAPSNAAVDNIVSKVIEEGFCDGEGRRYFPKIVRVGRGLSANVQSVGLENQVDQICSQPLEVIEGQIDRLRHELMVVERDSLTLRDQLRDIVAWIEHDPVRALEEIAQAEAQRNKSAASALAPADLPQYTQHPQPQGSSSSSATADEPSPPLPQVSANSDPPPQLPSATGFTAKRSCMGDASIVCDPGCGIVDIGEADTDVPEEEEEEEAFPASFMDPPPAWDEQHDMFNARASGQALNAFLDDGSVSEEDEPLPGGAGSNRTEGHEGRGEPSSSVPQLQTGTATPSEKDTKSYRIDRATVSSASNPIIVDGSSSDDTSEQDEPLPGREQNADEREQDETLPGHEPNAEDREQDEELPSIPGQPKESQYHEVINSPRSLLPSSPPPPPPPLSPVSPPPPPPLLLPPDLPDGHDRPLSPAVVISQSPRPPPPTTPDIAETKRCDVIDYSRYHPYVAMAQRINGCLEKLAEVKLELQRHQFARQAVSEMSGKLSQSTRQSLEVSFLDTAHIVFTTLSSAGVAALDASARYDVLVVDEAAQAVELSTIIPMKFGSKQCVLVGDPQQLSATVFSRNSGQSLYERSLFERLESCEHPVHMLRTQYRSHPMISDFPRNYFYNGKLQDGDNVKGGDYVKPYHNLGPAFMPLVFWNLLSSREKATKSVSRLNVGEADLAVNLYLTLRNSCPSDSIAGKVGMITPYSQQMEELRRRFRHALGERYEQEVEINTVDGFQGREKDIIILSTVRADPKAGVGFLNDIRRMNVALTRAKFACYVIGKEKTLRSSKPWSALLDHAYNRQCIVHVESPLCNLLKLQPLEQPAESGRSYTAGTPRSLQHQRQMPPKQHDASQMVPPGFHAPYGPSGHRWNGSGRANDGTHGGRWNGPRGGRGNRGRRREAPMPPYASHQQFGQGPGPQYPRQPAPGEFEQHTSMDSVMQRGGRPPAAIAPPPPAPGYPVSRGPAPVFRSAPVQAAGPYPAIAASTFPQPMTNGPGRAKPRDPRHRGGRQTGPSDADD